MVLALFFSSNRPGGYSSGWNAWVATRATIDGDWDTPVNLGPMINGLRGAAGAIASTDGFTLYFTSPRSDTIDLWQAPIIRIIDFNGDGIVDAADMCIMVDFWGTDEPLCDIGPMPWGDGIVDVQDLIVLAEHLLKNMNDPTLIAHWPLDETQGVIAYDSVSDSDGALMGTPIWQPNDGIVNGALKLDGIDDYVITGAPPNPEDGPFSILVWINGGAPGQVVVSQQGAVNWLMVDAEGNLMTELKAAGRIGKPLQSQTIITDGNWHRIGLVWDGLHRKLYFHARKLKPMLKSLPRKSELAFLMPKDKKVSPKKLRAYLKDLCRQCGFQNPWQYKLHTFRHFFASYCAQQALSYKYVLEWMGHSSSAILDMYFTMNDRYAQTAMNSLSFNSGKVENRTVLGQSGTHFCETLPQPTHL